MESMLRLAQSLARQARTTPLAVALAVSALACGQGQPEAPPSGEPATVGISVGALSVPGLTDACYRLTVLRADGGPVWQAEAVCSSAFGDGRGDATYIGPCDASVETNVVRVELEDLFTATGPLPREAYANPCGHADNGNFDGFGACERAITCLPDRDVALAFDLHVMRRASQGFFDVGVSFDDVFCSAKLDCADDDGPLRLLHHPGSGIRDQTAVLALACSAGAAASSEGTELHMDPIVVTCGEQQIVLDPSVGPGNAYTLATPDPDPGDAVWQYATFRGAEDLACGDAGSCQKVYWNVAIGFAPGVPGCSLTGAASASRPGAFVDGMTPAGATYPWIRYEATLTDAAGLACGQSPLDAAGSAVVSTYTTPTAPRRFCHSFDGVAVSSLDDPECAAPTPEPPPPDPEGDGPTLSNVLLFPSFATIDDDLYAFLGVYSDPAGVPAGDHVITWFVRDGEAAPWQEVAAAGDDPRVLLAPLPAGTTDVQVVVTPRNAAGDAGEPLASNVVPVGDAAPSGPGLGTAIIVVRDAPGGAGDPVGDLTLAAGESRTFYAAGYNEDLGYIQDVQAIWSTGGSLPGVMAGPQESFVFTATVAGTSGRVTAAHPHASVEAGQTGLITVVAPPPGAPSAVASTLSASPLAVPADGESTVTVTLVVKDANGTTLPGPHAVTFDASAGQLLGAILDHGDGRYTQQLQATTEPGTAVVTAAIGEQPVAGHVAVGFVEATDLIALGVTHLDCDAYATYQGQNLLIQGGTLTVDSRGCEPMELGAVTLRRRGTEPCVMTHSPATEDDWQKIDLRVDNLRVDAGCVIDVTGRGYVGGLGSARPNAYTHGNLPDGPDDNVGGTHGGLGGAAGPGGIVYGDHKNPREPGAGGGKWSTNASYRGGAGGGLVRIQARAGGWIVLDGLIAANGEDRAGSRGAGGAGGGVRLHTPRLLGAGAITAHGGSGTVSSSYGRGGGGGRVAISGLTPPGAVSPAFAPDQLASRAQAHGGHGAGGAGGAGTVWARYPGEVHGRLIVDNGGQSSATGSTRLHCIPEGMVDGVTTSGIDDLDGGHRPDLYTGTMVNVDAAATGDAGFADAPIFEILANGPYAIDLDGDPSGVTAVGATLRGVVVVDHLVVSGGGRVDARACDLWVRLGGHAGATDLQVDGELLVARADLGPVERLDVFGHGLSVTTALIGSGDPHFRFAYHFGGGSSQLDAITASALEVFGGASLLAGEIDVLGDATVSTGATLTLTDGLLRVGGTLLATDPGTTLTHGPTGTGPVERRLAIEAAVVRLQNEARVDVSALGWAGGAVGDASGHAPQASLRALPNCGGGHGGAGGNAGCVSPTFDSLFRPVHNGAGGGRRTDGTGSTNGGIGGGSVMIQASQAVFLDGPVRANAQGGGSRTGGAGGSITVEAPLIAGSGVLEAVGGDGHTSSAGGGGGGMIALLAGIAIDGGLGGASPWEQVSVRGGLGRGGAGTFYRRVGDAHGDLMVDNAGQVSFAGSTPLVFEGHGTVTDVTSDTLTAGIALDDRGSLAGYTVNPKVGQGALTLGDDVVFRIDAVSGPTLTLAPGAVDPATFVTPNVDVWSAYYRFDRLEVRGRAQLVADAEVRVELGDIGSDDPTTLQVAGRLDVRTLDVGEATTTIILADGAFADLAGDVLIGHGAADHPFDWELNDGTLTRGAVHGRALTARGATVNIGRMHILDDATLSEGATVTIAEDIVEVGGTLLVADPGTALGHLATGQSVDQRRLLLDVGTLRLQNGGRIDVSGRGFAGGRTSGHITGYAPLPSLQAGDDCGGGHGGAGGAQGCSTPTYDNLFRPVHNGAGGGRRTAGTGSSVGGNGGGSVIITAREAAYLDGPVRANGTGGGNNTGGAGGAITIEAPIIGGTGLIEATGGPGHASTAGGGGGGMIALLASVAIDGELGGDAPWTQVRVHGGSGRGGAGTFFRRVGANLGDLVVDNDGGLSYPGSTPLVFQGGGAVTDVTGDTLTAGTALDVYGPLTGYTVNPREGQGAVNLADDQVYRITDTDGPVLFLDVEEGAPAPDTFVTPYDHEWVAHYRFDNLEVRGRAQLAGDVELRVEAGDLASSDETTFSLRGALDVRTLDLAAVTTIVLDHGAFADFTTRTLIHGDATDYPHVWHLHDGRLTKDVVHAASITANGAVVDAGQIHVTGDATFGGGASVTLTDDLLSVGGALVVTDPGTVLTHPATAAGPEERTLRIEATALWIDNGGALDVSGRGWWGARTSGHIVGYSPYGTVAATDHCGGTHGGAGGGTSCAAGTFDSLFRPVHNGGGGGRRTTGTGSSNGGNGGGSVFILASEAAHLNGPVRANGATGSNTTGGAGGSIYVEAPLITGTGTLEATGADGNSATTGGGGGGMIALVAEDAIDGVRGGDTPWQQVKIHGGDGRGGSGTFYRRTGDAYGDLMLDNIGRFSLAGSTPLVFQGTGTVTAVTPTSLSAAVALDDHGPLDGHLINPRIHQGGPSLGDDVVYRIVATDGGTVTFDSGPDPTTFVTAGVDTWSAHYRFDNLEVRGRAQLAGDVELRVERGDIASGDDTTLVLGGALEVRVLDIHAVTTVQVEALGGLTVGALVGGAIPGEHDPRLMWSVAGHAALPALRGHDVTIASPGLTVGGLDATGSITLTGAQVVAAAVSAGADLGLHGASSLTVESGVVDVGGDLYLHDTALLTHPATVGADIRRLDVTAHAVVVEPGARIDASAKGWRGAQSSSIPAQGWPDGGASWAAGNNSGGCHGGVGRAVSGACAVHGRLDDASWPGSGGGLGSSSTRGGHGGGVIRVTAANAIVVNGAVRANGEDGASSVRGGGGGGGGVTLSAPTLSGVGTVEARGGHAHTSYSGGGGGGGRVVLADFTTRTGIFDDPIPGGGVVAAGGSAGGSRFGGAGTIYLLAAGATLGDLIVDNGGLNAPLDSTPLATVGAGVSTAVTATTLEDTARMWIAPDYYAATYLRPDLAASAALSLDEHIVSVVSANTSLSLTSPDLPLGLVAGADYRGLTRVHRLAVRGGARVLAEGDLLVYGGGLLDPPGQLVVEAGAALAASHQLELVGVSCAAMDGDISGAPLVGEEGGEAAVCAP